MTLDVPMQRIGRHELGRLLGSGGMGRVYEAVTHGPAGSRRAVAVKIVAGGGSLRREARLGGLLRHPHLVDVYEVGEADGVWFCAMELCSGGAVADRLPLPPRAVVDVGLQVCAALAYAHSELGLVHLDLKPQNLLLDGATVKVADLGIARARGMPDHGRAAGTPGYMAPEQRRGAAVDARTDVFALGVVLAELATGERAATTPETFDFSDAEPVRAAVPAWLLEVVDRCTADDPDDRYPSMDALAAALRALEAPGPSLREALRVPATAPRGPMGELPVESNLFVGREDELAAIAAALATPGALTLKGPGGIGKTRVALQTARRWADGAAFCELAGARSRDEAVAAVASVLGIPVRSNVAEQVRSALSARGRFLLVLDNAEQVDGIAELVLEFCRAAPELRVLVTARRAIGARVLELSPMLEDAAVALLVARARERGAEIEGDPALATLVHRLDGLPLALELAAGRIGVLSPAEVAERLGMSLLRSGRVDAPDREATLRGAIDWSFGQLSEEERATFARLSVFRGGFTAEAAEAVAGAALDALHQRSLVVAAGDRLRLLEPLREYAAEKLGDPRDAELAHTAWFSALGSPAAVDALELHGGVARKWSILADIDNFLAACERAIGRGDAVGAGDTLRAAFAVLETRGPYEPILRQARAALAIGADPDTAHRVAGNALLRLGRSEEAEAHYLQIADEGVARGNRGVLAMHLGRYAEARGHFEAALASHRRLGRRRNQGLVLGNLGTLAGNAGRFDEAGVYLQQALVILREVGDRALEGLVLGNLGLLQQERGDAAAALASYEAALTVDREVGSRQFELLVLGNLAGLLRERGSFAEARGHFEDMNRQQRALGLERDAAISRANLARTLHEAGQHDAALAAYDTALAALEARDQRFVGLVRSNRGRLHTDRGALADAAADLEAAVAVHRGLGSAPDEAVALGRLAVVEARLQRPEQALALLDRADALAAGGRPRDRAELRVWRAELAIERGDLPAARAALAEVAGFDPPAWVLARAASTRARIQG
jgi:predicted ATPase/Tfp pilus assembly protein PilF